MDNSFYLQTPRKGWMFPCAYCGKSIKEGDEGTERKTLEDETPDGMRFIKVFHAACEDDNLLHGEELN